MSLFGFVNNSLELPTKKTAIPDRPSGLIVEENHYISGNRIVEPVPSHLERGCVWDGMFLGGRTIILDVKGCL